jgi:hypothetical protein
MVQWRWKWMRSCGGDIARFAAVMVLRGKRKISGDVAENEIPRRGEQTREICDGGANSGFMVAWRLETRIWGSFYISLTKKSMEAVRTLSHLSLSN